MSRFVVGLLMCSALVSAARAGDQPPIRDAAGLFSAESIDRATEQIRELRRTANIDLGIETTHALPPALVERLGRASNPNTVFTEFALERAGAADVRGVFVLISAMPHHHYVAVVVRPDEYRTYFTDHDRGELHRLLDGKLLLLWPDKALAKAVALVGDRVKANRRGDSSWFGWGTVLAFLGGLVLLWIVVGLMRMRATADSPSAAATENEPANHAGFVPGLLGGMFGSVAGYWIYDTFLQSSPPREVPAAGPHLQPLPEAGRGDSVV